MTASQCLADVLSNLSGPDAIDDWVEAAWEKQVHGAEENSTGCREAVFDPIWQESSQSQNEADCDDHDVGDAGVKCFYTWPAGPQHRAEYHHIEGSNEDEVKNRYEKHGHQTNKVIGGGASTGQLHQGHVLTETVVYHISQTEWQFSSQTYKECDHENISDNKW